MINKKITIMISVIIVTFFVFVGVQLKKTRSLKKQNKVVSVGLEQSQQEYASSQLSSSFQEVDALARGKKLIQQGKLDEAIEYFKNIIDNKNFELKGLAKEHLIDAYEKRKDYDKAYLILYDDVQKHYKVPPEHVARIPIEERLKYLKCASDGEYELAVMYARLALEASRKLPLNLEKLSELYQQRLNDLIAAKDYILSLKKK